MPAGRPSKLTDELSKDFMDSLAAGAPLSVAQAYVGISTQTYYVWLERGEAAQAAIEAGEIVDDGEYKYVEFVENVAVAKAQAAMTRILRLDAAGEAGDSRVDQWWLSRMVPEFADKSEVKQEVSGPGGGPVEIVTDEQIRLMMEREKDSIELEDDDDG